MKWRKMVLTAQAFPFQVNVINIEIETNISQSCTKHVWMFEVSVPIFILPFGGSWQIHCCFRAKILPLPCEGGKITKLSHWVKRIIWFSKIAHHRPAHRESGSRQAVVGKYCCVWHSQCLNKHLWNDYCPDLFVNSVKELENPNVKLGW